MWFLLLPCLLAKSVSALPCEEGFLGNSCGVPPRDCSDLFAGGQTESGRFMVYPADPHSPGVGFPVYCDMETDGGGWLVFQRRFDGAVDFFRDWDTYERGFGPLSGEFWLGNYKLYLLTSQRDYELRIDLYDFEDNHGVAKYDHFDIAGSLQEYRLNVSGFHDSTSPAVGDSFLNPHNGHIFTTKDHDTSSKKCANGFKGGWWYEACHLSNLNGLYLRGVHTSYADGIEWNTWKGYYYSLRSTEMKIRPSCGGRFCNK